MPAPRRKAINMLKKRLKLRRLLGLVKICKNWFYVLLIVLFTRFNSLLSHTFFIFKMRNEARIKVRRSGNEISTILEVFVEKRYEKSFEITKNDEVIDIGAHVGIFSIYAANKGARIYSFEPSEENFKLLKENVELNSLNDRIRAFNLAISNKRGKRILHLSSSSLAHSLFDFGNDKKKEIVKSITLDDVFEIAGLSSCDFLKIDAEGSEYEMLFSAKKETLEKIRKIVVEYHVSEKKGQELMNFLTRNDFTAKIEPFEENIGLIYGYRIE